MLFSEGEDAHMFYLIKAGMLMSSRDGEEIEEFKAGSSIGAEALFAKGKREVTMTVKEDCTLWGINRVTYQRALIDYHKGKNVGEEKKGGGGSMFDWMEAVDEPSREAINDLCREQEFKDGDVIVKQGNKEPAFYMLLEGVVYVVDEWNKKRLPSLLPGQVFGEETLLTERGAYATTIAASSPTRCRKLTREQFNQYLGSVEQYFLDTFKLKALRSVGVIADEIDEDELQLLASRMTYQEFPEGTEIISQGNTVDAFYIVFEGEVRSEVKGGNHDMALLLPGSDFGAEGLLEDGPIETTYTASNGNDQGVVKCLTMTKVTFVDVMGDSVKDILKGQMAKRRAMWNRERDAAKDMKLTDVKMIRVLGQGTFGKVALVRHTVTGTMYALKRIVKAMVCDAEIGSYVENERHTMLAMDNQFVARLITSFQDTLSIYFLQELCENGELTQLLENGQALPHEAAQFYSANIVLGLKYLHENQVMFRDLKPENVLIDKDGYLKLIDFGMCKKMSLSSRTFTMCGTPEYCAPEIIYMLDSGYRQGYGFGIDVWSLGAMICIMATGISPVKGAPFDADNMLSISAACRKMRSYPMSYPGNIKNCCKNNDKVLKLCESLLHPNPDMRPGCNKNFFGSVKKNSFFKGVNWNNLSAKTTPAPPVRGWCMCVCAVCCAACGV